MKVSATIVNAGAATTTVSSEAAGTPRSLKDLEGFKILATDGHIGKVHDFFFDDEMWHVRYLVVDTGHWLPGRKVLLPTSMLLGPDAQEQSFAVSLTRRQVRTSPDVDTDKPVSRIREIELHKHYNWPYHWGGVGAWLGPVPPVPPVEPPPPSGDETQGHEHLRSVREMIGYSVQAIDGEVGVVEDFIADDTTWVVRYLVLITNTELGRRRVAVAPDCLAGPISWSAHKVELKLAQKDIAQLAEWKPADTSSQTT